MGIFGKFLSRARASKRWHKTSSSGAEDQARATSSADVSDGHSGLVVSVTNTVNEHHTYIRIECADRVGLLSEIASYLTAKGVNVVQADVVRDSKRVLYTLYVCEEESRCKLSEVATREVRNELVDMVLNESGRVTSSRVAQEDPSDMVYGGKKEGVSADEV